MLLRFTCENAFCFSEQIELVTTATSDVRHGNHVVNKRRRGGESPLRLAGIYGPNGHGKTRLVEAIRILRDVATGSDPDALGNIQPFKMKKAKQKDPSRFTVTFLVGHTEYEYGLVATAQQIEQEWLFQNTTGQESLVFSRERSKQKGSERDYEYKFGKSLRASKSPAENVSMASFLRVVSVSVSHNESFLRECINHKIEVLNPVIEWFSNRLIIIGADSSYSALHERLAADKDFLEHLNTHIREADTGISRMAVDKARISFDILSTLLPGSEEEMIEELRVLNENEVMAIGPHDGPSMMISKEGDEYELSRIVSIHETEDGEIKFDITDESSGTRRLLDLYPMLRLAEERDAVFIVDELDRKLHPILSFDLIRKFVENGHGQLVFTTHTTHLLDLALLRRDEVWLMQKDRMGSSALYSLAEFKIRPDLDIRKGYLQGRFGAIPFLGSAQDLGWCDAAR